MQYLERKPFTVPVGKRKPAECEHGWPDKRGRCVMCGEPVGEAPAVTLGEGQSLHNSIISKN